MKKLLATLMFVSAAALAQEKDAPKVDTVKFDAYCMSTQAIGKILGKYEEQPMMNMIVGRDVEGKSMEFVTILFANPKTGTWSLVERVGEEAFCVTATGTKIAPHIGDRPAPKGNLPKKYEQVLK